MARTNNVYTFEQKKNAVERYLNGESNLNQLGKEYGTAAATISQWVKKYQINGDDGLKSDNRGRKSNMPKVYKKKSNEEEIYELKKEVECLKKALLHFAEERILKR